MAEKMLMCVIIPAYNVEQYIESAIHSVLLQPRKDIQIVCINDGSTDGTLARLRSLSSNNPRVHVIDHPNGGVSAARNLGIEYVFSNISCDYMMFMDGDDLWYPNWLSADIESAFREQHDVIAFDFCRADADLKRRGPSMHTYTGILPGGDRAVQVDHQSMCASAYRAEFIRENGIRFHTGQKMVEDIDFVLEARSLARTVCFTERLAYVYRIRRGSAVQKGTSAICYYTDLFDGWIRSHAFLLDRGFESRCTYGAIKWYLDDFVREQFRQHGSRRALSEALQKYAFCMDGEGTDRQKVEAYLSRFSRGFELRQNLAGFYIRLRILAKRLPGIRNVMDRRHYPYSLDFHVDQEDL